MPPRCWRRSAPLCCARRPRRPWSGRSAGWAPARRPAPWPTPSPRPSTAARRSWRSPSRSAPARGGASCWSRRCAGGRGSR
ncbi:hypothetical protein ADL04_16185 [Streptomyces sp. NRRL B-3648]|nr:hypothetical protein ADL04_16185 [Streptomyces sp. NRRL B-3648]